MRTAATAAFESQHRAQLKREHARLVQEHAQLMQASLFGKYCWKWQKGYSVSCLSLCQPPAVPS